MTLQATALRKLRGLVGRIDRRANGDAVRCGNPEPILRLNEWQEAFCAWQSGRLGVPEAEIRSRVQQSQSAIRGGHGGWEYRRFAMLSYAIYLPFAADTSAEVDDAYAFHRHMHFLRMLSYPVPAWPPENPVVAGLAGKDVAIIDFGCGLAQSSVSLGRALRSAGQNVRISLADVSSLQLEFLDWFLARDGLAAETFRCTSETPFPDFAPADVLVAEEVLEHVHDPIGHVEVLDKMIRPGGFFIGNVGDHQEEFMHVSPKLTPVRERLLALGYREIETNRVFHKGS